MRRPRNNRFLAFAVVLLAVGGRVEAQEKKASTQPQDVYGILKSAQEAEAGAGQRKPDISPTSRPLTSQERSQLIDKGRIAEEAYQHLQGLREAGNPHILEGYDIERIEDDPKAMQVDQERLREEMIRTVENREGFSRPDPAGASSDSADAAESHQGHDHQAEAATAAPQAAPRSQDGPPSWQLILLAVLGAATVGWVWISNRK